MDSVVQVKAKAMRKPVDKMITLAKDGTLHARRQVRHSACEACSSWKTTGMMCAAQV